MQIWSNPYNEGDAVVSDTDKDRGTVISVERDTVTIQWSSNFSVVYPCNTDRLRKAYPWEH